MDRRGPPNWSRYQLTRGLSKFRQGKKWHDVALSRQDRSRAHHLLNAHYGPVLPGQTGCLFSGVLCDWSAPSDKASSDISSQTSAGPLG